MKRKPLYWRVGTGKWHEETFADDNGNPVSDVVCSDVEEGDEPLLAYCGLGSSRNYYGGHMDVEARRSAPRVSDQCAKCRASKARRKENRA